MHREHCQTKMVTTSLTTSPTNQKKHEAKGIETFLSARVDGIMVSIAKDTTQYSHFLTAKASNIPIMFFDAGHRRSRQFHSVVIDDYKGAFIATIILSNKDTTHRAPYPVLPISKSFNDRLKGYMARTPGQRNACQFRLGIQGNVSIEAGREGIHRLLQLPEPPDAVFAVGRLYGTGSDQGIKKIMNPDTGRLRCDRVRKRSIWRHITPTLSTIDPSKQ